MIVFSYTLFLWFNIYYKLGTERHLKTVSDFNFFIRLQN